MGLLFIAVAALSCALVLYVATALEPDDAPRLAARPTLCWTWKPGAAWRADPACSSSAGGYLAVWCRNNRATCKRAWERGLLREWAKIGDGR